MITDALLAQWAEIAKRDDWHRSFVGSDIRQLIGEVQRHRAAAQNPVPTYAQPCSNHEYLTSGCPDCGKLA